VVFGIVARQLPSLFEVASRLGAAAHADGPARGVPVEQARHRSGPAKSKVASSSRALRNDRSISETIISPLRLRLTLANCQG